MTRSYNGNPIDGTEQYITERPYKGRGETVSGSDPDSIGRDSASFGGGSDLQEQILKEHILKEHILNPELTPREISDRLGCCHTTVWRVVNRQDEQSRYQRDNFDDLSDNASRVVWIRAANPEKTQRAIAAQVGISEGYVSRILSHNRELVDLARETLAPYTTEVDR